MADEKLIVLVEDDASLRRALTRLLEAAGYEIAAFTSGEAALQSPTVERAVCLISDIQLPAMSGLELSIAVRRIRRDLPTVFVTAYDTRTIRSAAKAHGRSAYFEKPFEPRDLLNAVTGLLTIARSDEA